MHQHEALCESVKYPAHAYYALVMGISNGCAERTRCEYAEDTVKERYPMRVPKHGKRMGICGNYTFTPNQRAWEVVRVMEWLTCDTCTIREYCPRCENAVKKGE